MGHFCSIIFVVKRVKSDQIGTSCLPGIPKAVPGIFPIQIREMCGSERLFGLGHGVPLSTNRGTCRISKH